MIHFIRFLGKQTIDFVAAIGQMMILLWQALGSIRWMHHDRVLYNQQMYTLGVKALPLVVVVSIFAGAV